MIAKNSLKIAIVVAVIAALLVPANISAHREKSVPMVTVVIQFGNGEVLSQNVILPTNNTTALKATQLACENLSLDFHYKWYASWGGFVNQIGWEKNKLGYSWFLYNWVNNSAKWNESGGASSMHLKNGDTITWVYGSYDSSYRPMVEPMSLPGHYSISLSYRGNNNNTAYYQRSVLANTTAWRFYGSHWGISSTPAIAYGLLFEADASGIYAIGSGGTMLWNNSLGSTYQSSPAVLGNMVYIGTTDGYIRAFYVDNGTMAWERKISDEPVAASPKTDIVNGRYMVIIGTYNSSAPWGKLFAFSANSGAELWNTTLDSGVYMGTPAIGAGHVIVPLAGKYDSSTYSFSAPYGIVCVNESNGAVEWNITTTQATKYTPILDNNTIYAPVGDELMALNFTGGELWNITLNGTVTAPASHNGVIYVGTMINNSAGQIYALRNKIRLWNATVNGPLQGGVVVAGHTIIGVTNSKNSTIFWVNESSGKVIASYAAPGLSYVLATPVIYDSMLLVPSGSGQLLALANNALINASAVSNAHIGASIPVKVKSTQTYQAYLYYRNSTNSMFKAIKMNYDSSSGEYVGLIPAQNSSCVLQYYVVLYNQDGTTQQSKTSDITVSQAVPELNYALLIVGIIAMVGVAARRKL